jgi:hypothetical protein
LDRLRPFEGKPRLPVVGKIRGSVYDGHFSQKVEQSFLVRREVFRPVCSFFGSEPRSDRVFTSAVHMKLGVWVVRIEIVVVFAVWTIAAEQHKFAASVFWEMNQPYRKVLVELAVNSHEYAELAIPILRTEPHIVPALAAFQVHFAPWRFRNLLWAGDEFIQFGLFVLLHGRFPSTTIA